MAILSYIKEFQKKNMEKVYFIIITLAFFDITVYNELVTYVG